MENFKYARITLSTLKEDIVIRFEKKEKEDFFNASKDLKNIALNNKQAKTFVIIKDIAYGVDFLKGCIITKIYFTE